MNKYTFEPITQEHIEEVRHIYSYYIEHTTATYHKKVISNQEMEKLVLFDNPKYESYVIKEEDVICGYVILAQFKVREAFDQTAEVTIYLKHGYEGKKIGTLAMGFVEERARAKELHVLIGLICGENTGSIALFEKCGYEKCAHYKEVGHKFGRWLDLVAYQKVLN